MVVLTEKLLDFLFVFNLAVLFVEAVRNALFSASFQAVTDNDVAVRWDKCHRIFFTFWLCTSFVVLVFFRWYWSSLNNSCLIVFAFFFIMKYHVLFPHVFSISTEPSQSTPLIRILNTLYVYIFFYTFYFKTEFYTMH